MIGAFLGSRIFAILENPFICQQIFQVLLAF